MEMLVPAMNSRRRDPQLPSSSTVPSAYLLAAFSVYVRIPRALAAPAASDPSSSSPYSPPPTATDIVSPSPPVEFASSSGTHLSTYGIVGIVISGSILMTAVIGYGLRSWKRYKRSRLPPSAQYRESVRVAAKDEAENAAAEGRPASSGAETREIGGGGAGVGAQGAAAASRQPDSEAGKRKGEGASASAARDLREKRTSRSSSSRKPARGTGSKGQRESKSRSVTFSDAGPSAGPGPSTITKASRPQSDLSGIEEVPR